MSVVLVVLTPILLGALAALVLLVVRAGEAIREFEGYVASLIRANVKLSNENGRLSEKNAALDRALNLALTEVTDPTVADEAFRLAYGIAADDNGR